MKKELKKRHLVGLVLIGVAIALLLFVGFITWAVYSEKVTLTFSINETGEGLEGVLYQGGFELGDVKNGKIDLVWQDFYPGEISLFIEGIETPFLFDLSIDSINYGSQEYYVYQYEIDDVSKGIEDYNLESENEEIIQKINEQRSLLGFKDLKSDSRLNDIAKLLAKRVVLEGLDRESIDYEMVSQEMVNKKIFFIDSTNYWYDYTISSNMDVSEEYFEEMNLVKFWMERFSSEHMTNIGVATECNSEKRCFTLVIASQNKVFYENTLKNDYLSQHDIFYTLQFANVNINYESDVKILFNSNKNAIVYLLNSSEDYEKLLERRSYNKIFEMTSNNLSKDIKIKPNNTLVLHANSGDIKYTLEVWENKF